MKKGLKIYLVILVVLAVGFDYLILSTKRLEPATTQSFSSGSFQNILVESDTDIVNVTTASDGYYRIKSSDVVIQGKHITGNFFQDSSKLPVGKWVQEDGEKVSYTVTSPTFITITLISTLSFYLQTIFLTIVIYGVFYLFGLLLEI